MTNVELTTELESLCADIDAEIARHNPVCQISGRCCRFKEYGHTLFLSQVEADRLFQVAFPVGQPISDATCPYQIDGRCTARERRPLACRIYFCDPNFADKQQEISERALASLKRMHERHAEPWLYQPLIRFLRSRFPEEEVSEAIGVG